MGGGRRGDETFIVHWDGSQWSRVPGPSFGSGHNYLTDVAAVAANDLWAEGYRWDVGGIREMKIVHWDGSQWSLVPVPAVAPLTFLYSVVALAGDDVWATGESSYGPFSQSLILHWNGSQWND